MTTATATMTVLSEEDRARILHALIFQREFSTIIDDQEKAAITALWDRLLTREVAYGPERSRK